MDAAKYIDEYLNLKTGEYKVTFISNYVIFFILYMVFVEPQFSGNMGFIACTMVNFNVENLILFNPREIDEDAYRFAKHGKRIIHSRQKNSKEFQFLQKNLGKIEIIFGRIQKILSK